jgi:phosphate transport system protein
VEPFESLVVDLFCLVSEALAKATSALLDADVALGMAVIGGDQEIDEQTEAVGRMVWDKIDSERPSPTGLRHLVAVLLVLPELERSADLAEHIAQRAVAQVGKDMTPVSRGIVQRMSEVALEMWRAATDAYANASAEGLQLHEADVELDILHDRLTAEVATGSMKAPVAAQVTLLARFYERIGDHAVNLTRRIGTLPG